MTTNNTSLSIIMPAYNEENRLPDTINMFLVWVKQNPKLNIELIIVNDGSTDKTEDLIHSFKNRYSWITLINEQHVGMMNAIISGINNSKYDLVGTLEADSPVHPKYFESFLHFISDNDIIIGSRFLGNKIKGKSIARRIISKLNSILFSSVFTCPIKDPQISFRLYKKKTIQKILPILKLKHDGFKSSEIIVKAHGLGFKLKEIPVEYTHKTDSKAVPGGIKAIEVIIGASLAFCNLWIISLKEFSDGILPICPIKGAQIIKLFNKDKNKVGIDDYC